MEKPSDGLEMSSPPRKRFGSFQAEIDAQSSSKKHRARSPVMNVIQRSELDSALALASLALNSPVKTPLQTREIDESQRALSTDTRVEATPVTPGTPMPPGAFHRNHVGFPAYEPQHPGTPQQRRPRPLLRRGFLSQHRDHLHNQFTNQHRHPSFWHTRQSGVDFQGPPPPPPPPPSAWASSQGGVREISRRDSESSPASVGHPRAIRQPSLGIPGGEAQKDWVCDFCNSASFATYDEACHHENECIHRPRNVSEKRQLKQAVRKNTDERESPRWCRGVTCLAVEPADKEWLSELNCFIRKSCVEAFSANEEDASRTSKRGRIEVGQVGIRCKFCQHRRLCDRAVAAVSYPTSLSGIYESVKRWQRVHATQCDDVPATTKAYLQQLQSDAVWVPTTRQYWMDSAKALGMVDTEEGIRFWRDPSTPASWVPPNWNGEQDTAVGAPMTEQVSVKETKRTGSGVEGCKADSEESKYLVFEGDQDLVPPYVFFLMRQVEQCRFTEADRFVARSKGPIGFEGFQCRHCKGHAGLGKYFPLTAKSLATNSTSQNIHAHVLKCRKCPQAIKDELVLKKEQKAKSPRLIPGWRRTFFDVVWNRLHREEANK